MRHDNTEDEAHPDNQEDQISVIPDSQDASASSAIPDASTSSQNQEPPSVPVNNTDTM